MQNRTTKKKLTPRQRKLKLKQQKQRRMMIICCSAAVLLLAVLVVVLLKVPEPAQRDSTWALQDQQVEVAAPPLEEEGYGTLEVVQVTPMPTLPPVTMQETPDEELSVFDAGPQEEDIPEFMQTPTPRPEVVSITISAAGDFTLGGDVEKRSYDRFQSVFEKYGSEYFLANVKSIFEEDDLTIVNLEGPLTKSTEIRRGRTFNFKGDVAYVDILTDGSVEVCNVANNHAKDYLEKGQQDTIDLLDSVGILSCGYEKVCFKKIRGVTIGFVGLTEWDYKENQVREIVSSVRQQCDVLICSFHGGEELHYEATNNQKKYCHAMVEAGADLVLGHHSHVVGGVEEYLGKFIVYSLGNFCFGGNANPSDKDTMIFRLRFDVHADGEVENGEVSIIPCTITSKMGTNNYQPTPVEGTEEYKKVMKKIAKYSSVSKETATALKASR